MLQLPPITGSQASTGNFIMKFFLMNNAWHHRSQNAYTTSGAGFLYITRLQSIRYGSGGEITVQTIGN